MVKPFLMPLLACFLVAAVSGESAARERIDPWPGDSQRRFMTYLTDGSPAADAILDACVRAERVVGEHGWRAPGATVRIEANPFDATAGPAALVLSSAIPPPDGAFAVTESLVARALAGATRSVPVEALARTVALHLVVPTPARRAVLEREWLARLSRGDVLSTALPELLWRTGGDRAIRLAASGAWPESAIAVLSDLGCEDPLAATSEIVLAALLKPSTLGFSAPPLAISPALGARTTARELALPVAGVRFLVVPSGSGALGIEALRLDVAGAWVAVRYALTGDFDAVRLVEDRELAVPLQGVTWAAVVIVNLAPNAAASINLRSVEDFPQHLTRWDFIASEGAANLAWETDSHHGLAAYVVESLAQSGDGTWSVEHRVMIPVADDGEESYGYAFAATQGESIAAYRLLALTTDGFLGEVSTFPVPPG